MVWREPKAHGNECYFCSCNVSGFNANDKHHILYLNLSSAILPVPHGSDVSEPAPSAVLKDFEESSAEKLTSSDCKSVDDSECKYNGDYRPTLFGQELNDLVRDLDFPKLSAFLLGSR